MQCSHSFDSNWGKQNNPTACWHQVHPRYWVLQQEKSLSYPPDCKGGVTENSPRTLYLGQSVAEKTSAFLAIFMASSLKAITNILNAS